MKNDILNLYLKKSVESGYLDGVKLAINSGADVNYINYLFKASINGYLDIVKLLVENNCDIHYDNERAMINAALYGKIDILKYLIEQGCDPHFNNEYILFWCCYYGYLDIIKYLFSIGCDYDKYALLQQAINGYGFEKNNINIIVYLITTGANIDDILNEKLKNKVKMQIRKEKLYKITI